MTKDVAGNMIEHNILVSVMSSFHYLSEGEKKATEGTGQATSFGTILMLVMSIVIIGIQYIYICTYIYILDHRH